MAEELPIPIEIPWQLASTTLPFGNTPPAETSISLFTYLPDSELTADDFPDQQLVFLKVAATLAPAAFPAGTSSPVASALGEGLPCYHAQVDLTVRLENGQVGTIRPYFHAAAPLRREMVQSGVVGGEAYEGEAKHQAVGHSGSQLHETSVSTASTASFSAGGSFMGFGASASFSQTDVAGRRSVDQVVDSTNRDASQERRELVSHMTTVENILTLLSAKYVGTPYLRFSLSPRPLEQLSVDPSDPSLWFGQLLQRRSSGIEGVQEFTTVIVVPKGEDFCVSASLKRVCVLDPDPPAEPDYRDRFQFNQDAVRLLDYMERTYPVGTPVDDLDVDIRYGPTGSVLAPEMRPVIEGWWLGVDGRMIAGVLAPNGKDPDVNHAFPALLRGYANYKTFVELWLETLRDEFERACSRSPLEDGLLFGDTRTLDTCFTFNSLGALGVLNSQSSVVLLRPVTVNPGDFFGGPPRAPDRMAMSVRNRATETIVRWNNLAARLRSLLDNPPSTPPRRRGRFDDQRISKMLLLRWSKLRRDDDRNLSLAELGKALELDSPTVGALKKARIDDLRSLARALLSAPQIERYNAGLPPPAPRPRGKGSRAASSMVFEQIAGVVDNKLATSLQRQIAKILLAPLNERNET